MLLSGPRNLAEKLGGYLFKELRLEASLHLH